MTSILPARLAITLWQPWASLILELLKISETRGWLCPKSLLGQRLGIHAGKRRPVFDEAVEIVLANPDVAEFMAEGEFPLGVMLCSVLVVDCGEVVAHRAADGDPFPKAVCVSPHTRKMWEQPMDGLGDYRKGRFVWDFADVEPWPGQPQMKGKQGIWNVADSAPMVDHPVLGFDA